MGRFEPNFGGAKTRPCPAPLHKVEYFRAVTGFQTQKRIKASVGLDARLVLGSDFYRAAVCQPSIRSNRADLSPSALTTTVPRPA